MLGEYLGDFPAAGQVIPYIFPAYDNNNPTNSVTITGLAITGIEVYKGVSMTQRASDAGYALLDTTGIDIDSTTGVHGFSIDTADNTDPGFYAAGYDYTVVVNGLTINGGSISMVAFRFSIDNRGLLRPTTASRTLDVSATGEAGLDLNNVNIPLGELAFLGISDNGTAQGAGAAYIDLRAATPFTADSPPIGQTVFAKGSTQGYWQSALITAYDSLTQRCSVTWPVTPSGTITYFIQATPAASNDLPFPADLPTATLVKLFTSDSGESYATSIAGSLVKEIADNAASTIVAAIKAKTDQLSFGASSGNLTVNLESIKDKDIGPTKPYNTAT